MLWTYHTSLIGRRGHMRATGGAKMAERGKGGRVGRVDLPLVSLLAYYFGRGDPHGSCLVIFFLLLSIIV